MTRLEQDIREIKRTLKKLEGDAEWLTPEKVRDQYGYGYESLRKLVSQGKLSVRKGKSGRKALYRRTEIEDLFVTIER